MSVKHNLIESKIAKSMLELETEMFSIKESILEQLILEGVDDPGILKCVFLAGGPGSGKSFAVNQVLGVPENITTGLSSTGLKVVNSDPAFELFLKRKGVNPKSLVAVE